MKHVPRLVLAAFMVGAGVTHFAAPEGYIRIVPKFLPAASALVFASGAFEVLGGIGLLVPLTRRWAAWGLVALLVAVVPANVNMAVNYQAINVRGWTIPAWLLWARVPAQALLVAWAYAYTRPSRVRSAG